MVYVEASLLDTIAYMDSVSINSQPESTSLADAILVYIRGGE